MLIHKQKHFALKTITIALALSAYSTSQAQTFNYGEALQKSIFFYDIQRLGKLSTASGDLTNRLYWRGDSFLQDYALPNQEGAIDLGGGFADAGDNVKFNFPMAAATTMLAWSVVEFRDAYIASNQLQPLLANLRWATDYLLKCWDPVNKRLYGQVSPVSVGAEHSNLWMPYEVIDQASLDKNLPRFAYYVDPAHPGTDLAGETVAALTAASIAFSATDPTYATKLLDAAKNMYATLVNTPTKGKYSDNMGRQTTGGWQKADVSSFYNSWSGFNDEIAWSSMWLYRATQDANYIAIAKQFIPFGNTAATQSWDDKSYGTYLLMAKFLPDSDPAKATAKQSAQNWLDSWAQGKNGHVFSKDGLAIATALSPWGNARYAASTAFTALIYDTYFGGTTYHAFAKNQIDYLLGKNSKNYSYVEGYGTNFPRHSHHATAEGRWGGNNDVNLPDPNRHVAYGALVGGPKDTNDTYVDDRGDYIGNEVALDYNAGLVGALAKLYAENGGNPLPANQFPPTRAIEKPPVDEFFVNGQVQSGRIDTNQSSVQVSLLATNHTAWPPRVTNNLKIKYFLNLADKPANGTVKVLVFNTDARAVVSDLKLYDSQKQIYYVEVWFKNIPIYPGGDERVISSKETQLQFQFNWPHDYTKDWSYTGLGSQNNPKEAPNIPIYEFVNNTDKLLFGAEPTVKPQGNIALNFAANLPQECLSKADTLVVEQNGSYSFVTGTAANFSAAIGGPYAVSLNSTATPIVVDGGTCKGTLDASTVNVPGTLTANYVFTPTPPVDKGTIQVLTTSDSDPKCNSAQDTAYLDQSTNGTAFKVSDGFSTLIAVGTHQIKLASNTSIPAGDNQNGTCKSTLDQTNVTVTKDQTTSVKAKYTYTDNTSGMTCFADAKVTAQSNWGNGIVNTFQVNFTVQNFPKDPNGKTNLDASFVMKNNFVQNFWGNFSISSSSYNQNTGMFKGEIWPSQSPALGGFIDNKIPLNIGDNPLQSITLNGVVCKMMALKHHK